MVFSSNVFLLFFLPLFMIGYYACPKRFRNYVILLFSIVFYAYGAPDFILWLLATTIANFYLVKAMRKTDNAKRKKLFCGLAIGISLSLLVYFKYANFLIDNVLSLYNLFNPNRSPLTSPLSILLPIGISFFTFQSITYVIDTYRGNNEPMEKLTDYIVYIMMFPQLIAGPIVRYCDIEGEIRQRHYSATEIMQGFYRFIIGLSKKVLIADVLGAQVDQLLATDLTLMDTGTAWITIAAYTMQLYFDFSGYSDMAIGLGKMMGFHFPENFDNPYNSRSITEFWRRWHITLGSFMRNYLYIPLGGNRCSKRRMYFNLWVVFLLSGLWHGASWNFVIWGAYHGLFICLEKVRGERTEGRGTFSTLISHLLTLIIVMVGWALFRIENLGDAFTFISRLFAFSFKGFGTINDMQFYAMLFLALAFSFLTLFPWGKKLQDAVFYKEYPFAGHLIAWPIAIFLLLFCITAFNIVGFSPFIYFRF